MSRITLDAARTRAWLRSRPGYELGLYRSIGQTLSFESVEDDDPSASPVDEVGLHHAGGSEDVAVSNGFQHHQLDSSALVPQDSAAAIASAIPGAYINASRRVEDGSPATKEQCLG